MTTGAGQSFGIIGPLAAFPLRLAMRHANRVGSKAGRGVRRQTTHAVVGRKLLEKENDARIAARLASGQLTGLSGEGPSCTSSSAWRPRMIASMARMSPSARL